MADHTRAQHLDAQQHRVPVTVRPRRNDLQTITGGFAFRPKRLPGTAVEGDESRLQRRRQRFPVHETHHEQLTAVCILNHRGRQALHFVEVNLHRNLLFQ